MTEITNNQAERIIELLERISDKMDDMEPITVYLASGGGAKINLFTSDGIAKILTDVSVSTRKDENVLHRIREAINHF